MANRISYFEAISMPAEITKTALDNYDNYWASNASSAVDPLLTNADNIKKLLGVLFPGAPGTRIDLEKKYYEGLGANAKYFTLADVRVFAANSEPVPPYIPFVWQN